VSTIEELLERKSSSYGLENEITAVGICHADYATLTYPISSCRSVTIVRPQTQAMEFVCVFFFCSNCVFKFVVCAVF
jgi:hypothetical protein